MSMQKLCRLCMSHSNLIHSVLDDNLMQKIAICVSILINPADEMLPLDLCALCAFKVKDFFEFRQNCQKVQQLLEQDACSRSVQPVPVSQSPPPAPPMDTFKYEEPAPNTRGHLQITKFEVIVEEGKTLNEVQHVVVEEPMEESVQMVEHLEEMADEEILVEDLVEQDEVLSETGQSIESEHEAENENQTTDERQTDYEIQMIELNFEQNRPESNMGEPVEEDYEDEVRFVEDTKHEEHIQESTPVESTSPTALQANSRRNKQDPHAPKAERDEKQIYKSLLKQCELCGKSVERNRMEGHRNRHRNIRPYACKEAGCDLTFHCKISRRLHIKNRHSTEELPCEFCGKTYFSTKALYHHKKNIHTEKHFSCEECGLSFVSNARLSRHVVTHTDEREFKCPYCPKQFYRSNNLKVHIRSHTKEKPFSCSSCDKAFGYQRLLREHLSRHHKGN